MTVSMRVMSAGDGYKYLLRTVAAGDGDRSLSTPLTRYYAEEGSPPGRWLGTGVAALGGLIVEGDQASESQLQLLVGMGQNPVTGDPLGLAYPAYKTVAERISERTAALARHSGRPAVRRRSRSSRLRKRRAGRGARWRGMTSR